MKRLVFSFIAVLCFCASMHAAELTPEQRKAKNEISNALRQIATNVYDYDDETICFAYQNTQFYVYVSEKDTYPLYITVNCGMNMPEYYDSDVVRIAATNAASGMPVFVFSDNSVLIFDCEMYVKEAKPFIDVLPNMINALMKSWDNFPDEYGKALKEHTPKSTGYSSQPLVSDNVYLFPKINTADDSRLYITKVTLGSQYTILDMISYNGGKYQNCSISRNSYLLSNGKRYSLRSAEGITYTPERTDYPNWESGNDVSLSFRLFFSPLPDGTRSFSFSEGNDGWQLGGVELKHGKSYAISGAEVETSYQMWNCTSIEIRDDQTIVTKVVTPKVSGTYMYSSQDECIEDADTGRRYYLQESSIGFEGSPQITYSMNPIEFYEVYPALPSNVKTINIWSGSAYYVKNLKIR